PLAGVDAVEARPLDRRRRDPQVDLAGARLPQHLDQRLLGGAPYDRVVDDDQALALDVLPQRVELHADRPGPQLLAGGDEAAADVAVLDQPLPEGDPAAVGEPLGGRDAGLGHAHDHVGLDRRLLGQLLAHADPSLVDAAGVQPAVGPGEVHELEQAQPGIDP